MKQQLHLVLRILVIIIFSNVFFVSGLRAQQDGADSTGIRKLLDKAEAYQKTYTSEKLYINFDKPYYAAGDTAWLKAYVLTGAGHSASVYSSKLYVELLDAAGKMVQRLVLPVANGLAQGYFALDAKKINEGNYTVRAYTNWLQNFGADFFFYKQFSVGKLGGKTWLVTEQHRRDIGTDSNHVQLAMRFTDAKGLPLVTRKVAVRIMDGTKPLLKSEMSTGVDGALTGAFSLPAKVDKKNLNIAVEDLNDKEQHITFPFYPSGTNGDIDLQFMAEGGSLVAGLLNRIGFKAIGEDGLSRDVKGVVVDSKGEEAATLQSVHNGMGSFVLVPQAGENYVAKVMVDGKEKRYPLPKAKDQGIALRIDGVTHADELYIYISTNIADNKRYTLIAQSGNRIYFGSGFKFNTDNYFNTRIPKDKFPTGMVTLTILGPDNKPLNQRNIFVNHHDGLKLTMLTGQSAYNPKDSIALDLHVVDKEGKPVQANFSVAVTDDAQVKDAAPADNIESHILLASELKGNIENPAWYFSHDDNTDVKLKDRALDNLLLTQGWLGIDWTKIDEPIAAPIYQPEPDVSITGSLKGLFKKSGAGVNVSVLANGKQPFLQDTISDINGRFAFRNLPLADTVAYLLKLHNTKGKSVAAEIFVDEFKPTNAALANLPRMAPWNMNTDTSLINYIKKANQRNVLNEGFTPTDGKLLKQVDIKAKREVKYVGGEFGTELLKIDEQELIAAKKMSLLELISKKLPGFRETNLYASDVYSRVKFHGDAQYANGNMLINDIIADGQSVANPTVLQEDVTVVASGVNGGIELKPGEANTNSGFSTKEIHDNMKQFLNSLGADDVKNISLYRGTQLFLVIETRSGHGAFSGTSRGAYAYRPPFMQFPKQFYSPRYTVKNKGLADMRSTIHWEPNLVTDVEGNAKLSFFAAGTPSTYTVIIEGTDMQGYFGVDTRKITVSPNTAVNK